MTAVVTAVRAQLCGKGFTYASGWVSLSPPQRESPEGDSWECTPTRRAEPGPRRIFSEPQYVELDGSI